MAHSLAGKRIILTGASSGLGRSLAIQLAKLGGRIVIAARSEDRLEDVAGAIRNDGGEAWPVVCDLAQAEDRQRLVDTAVERLGGLDLLINNAGVGSRADFADTNESINRRVMEINFFAPAELIRWAIPHLVNGSSPVIVNIAAIEGRRSRPGESEYSASKFALCGLSESLRCEMARFDIDVVTVVPGSLKTEFRDHLLRDDSPVSEVGALDVDRAAKRVIQAIVNREKEAVIGGVKWTLRLQRLAPRLSDWLLRRRVRKAI